MSELPLLKAAWRLMTTARLTRSLGSNPLGELDDQSFRTADIAEPIDVLVITDLTDRVKAVVSQSVDDRVEVIDLYRNVAEAHRFAGKGCTPLLSA
jgi:hypothetical protein